MSSRRATNAKPAPVIYVFCNTANCHLYPGDWHSMVAIAEDGTPLAQHICSSHGWAVHDMGISESGWKRDRYAAHYPDGFVVEWVSPEKYETHVGFQSALARRLAVVNDEREALPEGEAA